MSSLVFVILCLSAAQPNDPKPIDSSARPIYPAAARAAMIEGDVQYRAIVRTDGSVESVTILRVPQADIGFESAVTDTVKKWRFQPRPGVATATYSATMRFELSIPLEWIFPLSSRTTWMRLDDLVRELKLGVERLDDKQQLQLTTRYGGEDDNGGHPRAVIDDAD